MELTKTFLNQVQLIQDKYNEIAEYTGEHYNVFDILGVRTNELSHSAIIGNLLNVNGKHAQKDTFLKMFLEEIKDKFEEEGRKNCISEFNTTKSSLKIEKHAGSVDIENNTGGRIDIIVNDGTNNIIIENKIYADDQYQQLKRYYNHDRNAPILYLTLEGKPPSANSKIDLIEGEQFICISYKTEIKSWLEKCIEEMANKPIIRETLNQYLNLINSLTNQISSNKNKMEIIKLIKENLEQAETVAGNFEEAKLEIIKEFWKNITEILKDKLQNWKVESKSNYINSFNYILLNQEPNSTAYFYCRYHIKSGELSYGITPNKELQESTKQELIRKFSNGNGGMFSIKSEKVSEISLSTAADLSHISKNSIEVANSIATKMETYMTANAEDYKTIVTNKFS